MSGATKEIRLTRGTNRLSSKETYVARLAQRSTLSYDEVLDEVIERGFLNISKPMLKMILEHTLETMIANTLQDGNSRRLGDYFVLQMEVKVSSAAHAPCSILGMRSARTQKRGQDVQEKPRRHTCILVVGRDEQRRDGGV